MEMLSSEYGWTPDEIRELKYNDVIDYLDILREKQKIEKYNQMKYGRQ